jgi:hypothetical protein
MDGVDMFVSMGSKRHGNQLICMDACHFVNFAERVSAARDMTWFLLLLPA